MKLILRFAILAVVVAGATAASIASAPSTLNSHQSGTAALPVPQCGPNLPTCPQPRGSAQ